MEPLTVFAPELARLLPETHALLQAAYLVVHPAVGRIVLTGSRGVRDAARPDSDVDLSLVLAGPALPAEEPAREQLLRAVVETTLSAWRGPVECDLAALYDERGCGLRCFSGQRDAPPECPQGGSCRFGIYKLQKGFAGDVSWAIIELPKVYPVLEIWRRQSQGERSAIRRQRGAAMSRDALPDLRAAFEGLDGSRCTVQLALCRHALGVWEAYVRRYGPVEYVDSVVGLYHCRVGASVAVMGGSFVGRSAIVQARL